MMRLSSPRRRPRSVRLVAAAGLLATGTVAVLVAVTAMTTAALVTSAVLAVGCGWAAAALAQADLRQARQQHAEDRAAQAKAFRALFVERATEHALFASRMRNRLDRRERAVRELQGTLALAEVRGDEAEHRARQERERAVRAELRVVELEVVLDRRSAEQVDELASWDIAETDTVVDLLAWEDRHAASTQHRKHA